jgi:hypothetical protein
MAALFVPNAFAAPFAFEKTNCLSLLGIEKLMAELEGGRTRRAVKKTVSIWRQRLLIVVHASDSTVSALSSEVDLCSRKRN